MNTISSRIEINNNINRVNIRREKKKKKNNENKNKNKEKVQINEDKNKKSRGRRNRNVNHLFNEFMDFEEQKIYDLEFEIEMLNLIELQKKRKIYNYNYSKLSKEEIEIQESFLDEHNWYHECDMCWENTRNGDCKCLGAVQKIDMVDLITYKSINLTTGEDKFTVIPHIVKQVPILFYV